MWTVRSARLGASWWLPIPSEFEDGLLTITFVRSAEIAGIDLRHPGLQATQTRQEEPGISQVRAELQAEPLRQDALFPLGLDRVIGQQNCER